MVPGGGVPSASICVPICAFCGRQNITVAPSADCSLEVIQHFCKLCRTSQMPKLQSGAAGAKIPFLEDCPQCSLSSNVCFVSGMCKQVWLVQHYQLSADAPHEFAPKLTSTRPSRGIGFPMITIHTAQQLRESLNLPCFDRFLDKGTYRVTVSVKPGPPRSW